MTTSAALCLAANWHTMEGLTEILPTGTREVYPAVAKELPKKVDDTTYEAVIRAPMPWAEASPAWSPCWTPSAW